MGVISTEMYEALLLAHVPEDKAKAAAAEVAKSQDVASKSDVLELGAQLQAEIDKRFAEVDKRFAEVDKRFAESRAEMDKRFAESRAEMDKRFAELRAEMDKRFAELRAEMDKRFAAMDKSFGILKFAVFSGGSVILALLIKLVFFP